ncbi:uncharacterized protein FIBRA_07847 [Fibroporia radiculosa]|uniref:NmrA-like domain-containing protein n=1 Tax=Fibroporia radiculosa TaxID=599839 RepID=J4GFQ1_9APHY|nr:uncharacterized protein FIBRA_07847 [Fibroporia radiculosa]CCM05618.1 predicted protein [Fibroporia radiculosa]
MPRLIAVCGATGNQGGSVAKLLLQYPNEYTVRALTRDTASPAAQALVKLGAQVVKADLTVPSDVNEALRDCWGVFAVTNFYDPKIKDDPGSEERQGKNLVDASLAANVKCFVWSTLPSSRKISGGRLVSRIYEGKYQVDDYIRETGLPASFLYTGNFYENMVYRSHMQYHSDRDLVEFRQPIVKDTTECETSCLFIHLVAMNADSEFEVAMLYVEKDLSGVTKAVFDQWDSKAAELNHQYLYVCNARVKPVDILASVKKITGKECIYTVLPTTGVPDRDIMFQLYNEMGMYGTKEIPDENILKLGVKLHGIDDFWRDLPGGHELRMQAYRIAWNRCFTRMQSIIHALYASIISQIVSQISDAYSSVLPGLPYFELPVIAISAEGGGFSVHSDICRQLDDMSVPDSLSGEDNMLKNEHEPRGALQIHLYAGDCLNTAAMMKAVVTGFLDLVTESASSNVRRRPAASLATYDINLLKAWYAALERRYNLVVFMHNFEQFDSAVVQDVCSHVPQLPLIFVLAMSSPSSLSHLHAMYRRSTLALLRIHSYSVPSGPGMVESIVSKTFFDVSFEPSVMLGPDILEYISDFASRHTASIDGLSTILQLAHIKHFTEPLTAFVHSSDIELNDTTHSFYDALQMRLLHSAVDNQDLLSSDHDPFDADGLLHSVDAARAEFQRKLQRFRAGFCVARTVQQVALEKQKFNRTRSQNSLTFASTVLRGRASRDVHYLGLVVKKLSGGQLRTLLERLYHFFEKLETSDCIEGEEDARLKIHGIMAQFPQDTLNINDSQYDMDMGGRPLTKDPAIVQLADALGEWLVTYLEERFVRLDEGPLWDVWYMGSTPFPSEVRIRLQYSTNGELIDVGAQLINPAPRVTIVSALAHPYDFAHAHTQFLRSHSQPHFTTGLSRLDKENSRKLALWELPDTSMLFRRYIEAGRMINIYDWFQSFVVVLEDQRRRLRRLDQGGHARGRVSPAANLSRQGKAPEREFLQMEIDGEDDEDPLPGDEDGDDSEEAQEWLLEVQARFIRALHELEHMGFIKHTGRKADHVIRTVYDATD